MALTLQQPDAQFRRATRGNRTPTGAALSIAPPRNGCAASQRTTRARWRLHHILMDAYTALLGLIALILFYSGWREKAMDNGRDAKLLALCGTVMAASAAFLGLSA